MHILIIGINFYPELTGIGKYTGELAVWLQEQGQRVTIITAPPYYPHWQVQEGYVWWRYKNENWGGIQVLRCPIWVPSKPSGVKRILHLVSFAISCIPALLNQIRQKPDLVFCVAPAITSAVPALFFAKLSQTKSWLHMQDFEVDAAIDLGILSQNTIFKKLAIGFERVIITRFEQVSTISKRMVARLENKGVGKEKINLIPNWVDTEKIYPLKDGDNPLREKLLIPKDRVIVLYAGNMGHKQGIEILVEVAERLLELKEIHFVLCGEGALRKELEHAAVGLANVSFLPLQPVEMLNQLLNLADIHVLPQRLDTADLVMPSKLTGMLASGKAVIALALPGTEVAEVVGAVGKVVLPEQPDALAEAIHKLVDDEQLRAEFGTKGRAYAEENWAYQNILSSFSQQVEQFIH